MFLEAIRNCSWLVSQEIPKNVDHSYFTFGVRYLGEEINGIKWKEFYNRYKKKGGDGFYACWKPPYLEPSLYGKKMGNQIFKEGLCPIAENYQKSLMVFKTNYRNLDEAKKQTMILSELIDEIGRT